MAVIHGMPFVSWSTRSSFIKGNTHDQKNVHNAIKSVQYLRVRTTSLCGGNSHHFWLIKMRLPNTCKHFTTNNS
ncbi:hypothetical protein LX32DRAFT_688463 [Colletotrichum zoysiae]|uniref:Uncharacterized protein n=1 Tax=Colletotrichum zoysiae TaxID=1216348 RepID=A0AAD9HVW1_9PEZI|nr:hypothetical protein LX32DRAFT_688463 [Colletotrichum zoysiae]